MFHIICRLGSPLTGMLIYRTLEEHLSCCVIDPFNNIYPVLDRLKIQHVLLGLENLNKEGHSKMRGPYFLKVHRFL